MDLIAVNTIVNQAIQIILITSLPSIGLGLAIGVFIAVIQAVTQVQEQTLTFVPKLIVVLLIIGATFSWMSNILLEFTIALWENIPVYSK